MKNVELCLVLSFLIFLYVLNETTGYPFSTTFKTIQRLEEYGKPSTLGWCSIIDTSPTVRIPKNSFSFSLFVSNKDIHEEIANECSKRYQNVVSKNINSWYNRYGGTQYSKMKQLFMDNNWKEYGVIHFLSLETAFLPWVEDGIYTNKTLSQHYLELNSQFPGKYKQYIYTCPNFQTHTNITYWNHISRQKKNTTITTPYFGTLVRFLPLIIPGVDVVLFRDAHTTMPNPYNNIDKRWCDYWLTTDKKFWMYHAPYYNPYHAYGEHVPFAATWGARRITNRTILTSKEWNDTFGNITHIDNKNWYYKDSYGIDERMFYKSLSQYIDSVNGKTFIENTYLVGMTHLFYLFLNPSFPQDYSRFYENNSFINTTPTDLSKSLGETINIHNNSVYTRNVKHWWVGRSMYNDIRCTLLSMLKEYSGKYGMNITDVKVNTFFNYIEHIQSEMNTTGSYVERQMVYQLPSKYHIWEYIFDYDTHIVDKPMIPYLEEVSKGFEQESRGKPIMWDILNSCKLTTRMFIGDVFNLYPHYYFNSDDTRKNLPNVNTLPEWHPLRNANKKELFYFTPSL